MELEAVSVYIAGAALVVAIVSGVVAIRSTAAAREANRIAERANSTAEQANTTAELANAIAQEDLAEQRRGADAAERQVAIAAEVAARYTTPWKIEWVNEDQYKLVNTGSAPEYVVELSSTVLRHGPTLPFTLGAQSGATFVAARIGDNMVTVKWHRKADHSDEPHTWKTPLPQKRR